MLCFDSVELHVVKHHDAADRARKNKSPYTVEVSSEGSHLHHVDLVMSAESGYWRSVDYEDVDNVSKCTACGNAELL